MPARRAPENPIVTPAMVRPSRADLEVVGVFNPGVARVGREVLLLLRVAEAPHESSGEAAAPTYNAASGQLDVHRWAIDAEGVDVSDPRIVVVAGRTWLTSLSHFRVARSLDGIRFEIDSEPAMAPATPLESYGIEDPRITRLDGTYWINYTAVSEHGIATALASTKDFHTFQRHGIIFPPPNRDVTVFPERIGGRYAALHRPMPAGLGEPSIWLSTSPDLMTWGAHQPVAAARAYGWDDGKVGGGAVPFKVHFNGKEGWLAVYHGVARASQRYALGALLLDTQDPARVIARSRDPILEPETNYERTGFFGGVVFSCGLLVDDDRVRVYYGAADGVTAVADLSLADILDGLT
ncbi:MAG: glycoside hydrolase family 130 protein [Gemmatimonadaceae bacterium]